MEDANVHEVVIIKRVLGGDHDDHHGGAWKIAFADFMTAMMALFLVLWLTSTNDKTKAVIAHYFNPVQLVDSTPQPPGLSDPKPGTPSMAPKMKTFAPPADQKSAGAAQAEGKVEARAESEKKPEPEQQAMRDETELFKNPYAVLAELAAKNSTPPPKKTEQPAPTEGTRGGSGAVGVRSGEAYRDPFEPLPMTGYAAPDQVPPADASPPPRPAAKAASPAVAPPPDAQSQVAALRGKIEAALKATAGSSGSEPKIEVRRTDEGILIGLTDDANFSMFASASAEPAPRMVALMDKIGRVLKAEKGKVTIRGFTDNRPFRSETYDNWRLSSARAHMAHYMLVRGGLDESRIERIEGFADRRPKNARDPGSAENRRIEILLRDTPP